jgi:nucleotide-binding universal stress UspA family protein
MKILLATDGSLVSQATGALVARLPWPATRELTVLSVVDKLASLPTAETRGQGDEHGAHQQMQHALRQEAQQILALEAERFTAMGWTPHILVREGHAAHEIVLAAEGLGTDVIAMGSRGMGGVRRFLLGSVSQQVMTYAPCSVLVARQPHDPEGSPADEATVPPGESDKSLRILLAYDGSPMAKAAVETLASLSFHEHTHILITTVMTLMTTYRMDILQTMTLSWQTAKQAAQEGLEQAAQRLRQATPNVTVQLCESDDTSQALLDAAQVFSAHLMVVGHQGKSGVERFLLGSVANRVMHHAPCSVWVMRG